MNNKLLQKMGCVAMASALLVGCGGNQNKDNRTMSFQDVEGKVTIVRDKKKTDAKEKTKLQSGDTVKVGDNAEAVVAIDKDKFAYVEENTEFKITAKGNEKDNKTTINLESGAITSEIQKKLSKESKYEIVTDTAKIDVKGTIYRVESVKGKDGVTRTYVNVFEGRVMIHAGDKGQSITGGYQLIINEKTGDFERNDKGEVLLNRIEYKDLPLDTLEYLLEMKQHNDRLDDFTEDELKGWIENKKEDNKGDKGESNKEDNKEDNKNDSNKNDSDKEDDKDNNKPVDKEEGNTDNGNSNSNSNTNKPSTKPNNNTGGNNGGNTGGNTGNSGNTGGNTGENTGNSGNTGGETTTPPSQGSGGASNGNGNGGGTSLPDYDPNYAATGGHPDDGVEGVWGKYFPTLDQALAFMNQQANDINAPYFGWFLVVNHNADGSVRVSGVPGPGVA